MVVWGKYNTMGEWVNDLFRKISMEHATSESKNSPLQKALTFPQLLFMSIGAMIGVSIFVITGVIAADISGPALMISFTIAGLACLLSAFSYAEFAAMVPISGSTYSYTYITLGELPAWIIGWDLILEYTIGVTTIAIGWSGYLVQFLSNAGIIIPPALTIDPFSGGIINLPGVLIIVFMMFFLIAGISKNAKFNMVVVSIKLLVILFFLLVGINHINPQNLIPFFPYGWAGVMKGAAIVFVSYAGFDAISTAAEEATNPGKTIPRALLGAVFIGAILYVAVTFVLCGILPFSQYHNVSAPASFALSSIGIQWGSSVIATGVLIGLTSGLMIMMYGQSRVIFAITRDSLLPKSLAKVHQKTRAPYIIILICGTISAILAGFIPLLEAAELANIGVLFAFMFVSCSVIILRRTRPDIYRPFKSPLVPYLPLASILICLFLFLNLPTLSYIRFVVWLAIGLLIYLIYGRNHSILAKTT